MEEIIAQTVPHNYRNRFLKNVSSSSSSSSSGGGSSGGVTEAWVNQNFVSIGFFNRLFNAYNGSTIINPNDTSSTIDNIKALAGFWTDGYVSALGKNNSGGGGGSSTLAGLTDVNLNSPQDGQALIYDSETGKWINGNGGSGSSTLAGLTDVTISNPSNNQFLAYINGDWVNANITWSNITNTPTTLAGYGIGDVYFDTAGSDSIPITLGNSTVNVLTSHQSLANYYTKTEADAKYMTITAFENLFTVLDDNGDKVDHPYSGLIGSIKSLFGFWTDEYISALGLNNSIGSGSLADLIDVNLNEPQNGQALIYDSTTGHWINGNVGGGSGSVTQINTGTGLAGGPITGVGTIYISSEYQGYIANGQTAYSWGNHSLAGYLTSVAFSDLTSHPTTLSGYGITDAINSSTVFWGQTVNNGVVNGSITMANNSDNINFKPSNGNAVNCITLNNNIFTLGYGSRYNRCDTSIHGYKIDMCVGQPEGNGLSAFNIDMNGCCYVKVATEGLRIGDGLITWDATNNALKITRYDKTSAANLYALGGISALGQSSGGISSTALADLVDVNLNGLQDGQILVYDSLSNHWINSSNSTGSSTLAGLTDVHISTPSNNQFLAYSNGDWVNANITWSNIANTPTTLAGYGIGDVCFGTAGTDYIPITLGSTTVNVLTTLTNYYTKAEADAKYMTIAAFENLFNAIGSDGTTKINHPYNSAVNSIKAMFGLWTNQYLSALGLNNSGGGGGSLAGLTDVSLNSPQNGQALIYNSSTGHWVNGTAATVTQINTGTGLTGGPITNSGTISINNTYQEYIAHGQTAYGWGDHSLEGYLKSVAFSDLTSHPTTLSGYGITDAINSSTTFWGQTVNNGAVNGNITMSENNKSIIFKTAKNTDDPQSYYYNTEYYTNCLLLNNSNILVLGYGSRYRGCDTSIHGYKIDMCVGQREGNGLSAFSIDANGRCYVKSATEGLRIGDGRITWDATNNALKITKNDGTAANLYALGGISALGFDNSSIGNVNVNILTSSSILTNNITSTKYYLDGTRYIYLKNNVLTYHDGSDHTISIL